MKYKLITALMIFSVLACTNNHQPMRTERMDTNNASMKIKDDGKILSIKVKTAENAIDYDENFDIRNMNAKQKEKLKKHILDSLGVRLK